MSVEDLRHFFGWCTALNYAVLILWFVLNLLAGQAFMRLCQRLFRISDETYNTATFYGIMYYKLGIILFMLMPYIALRIVK